MSDIIFLGQIQMRIELMCKPQGRFFHSAEDKEDRSSPIAEKNYSFSSNHRKGENLSEKGKSARATGFRSTADDNGYETAKQQKQPQT